MINIKTLKQKINLLEYIQKTLKSVESINLNKRAVLKKQYHQWIRLTSVLDELQENFSQKFIDKSNLLVIVGSDNSLCGAYNSNIIKFCKNLSLEKTYDKIIVLGKKIKKIVLNGNIEYKDYKNFTQNINDWYKNYGFNIDIIGHHTKDISMINLKQEWVEKKSYQKNQDVIIEGDQLEATYEEIFFQLSFMKIIYNIENQENLQRLMFLKSAIDNCQEEIQQTVKKYRSLRQENITKEINELISANL